MIIITFLINILVVFFALIIGYFIGINQENKSLEKRGDYWRDRFLELKLEYRKTIGEPPNEE